MKKFILFVLFLLLLVFLWQYPSDMYTNGKEEASEEVTEEAVGVSHADVDETSDSNHLKFKGVPIDGTLDAYVRKMKQKGFVEVESGNSVATLTGDFAGFKECTVHVSTIDGKDLVSKISVTFPAQEQWKYLHDDYKHLKQLLTEKYGEPTTCTEEFQNNYLGSKLDDNMKMHFVGSDQCKYISQFTTDKGEIVLWIGHKGYSSSFVALAYSDKINANILYEHAKEDL